jgi:hypothetical protein
MMHYVSNHTERSAVVAAEVPRPAGQQGESLELHQANLRRALVAAEQSVRFFPSGLSAHRKAKARVKALQNELRAINGQLGVRQKQDLGEVIISIIKERLSDVEWQGILSEARKRYQAKVPSESIASFAS